MSHLAFPLDWPIGIARTKRPQESRFDTTFTKARTDLITELRLIGAKNAVLSTNIELRLDGLPYSGRSPLNDDSGIAVYFLWKEKPMTFACDKWAKSADNIQAIVKTINAIRGIDRWGSSDMIERAFSGFTALPAPMSVGGDWRAVLNFRFDEYPSAADIQSRFKSMAKQHHADKGGKDSDMAALIEARDAALASVPS